MRLGDFTLLAKQYTHRPGYSPTVLQSLIRFVGAIRPDFVVADVGAGTGKLTQMLEGFGLQGYAVEPNQEMRKEGIAASDKGSRFDWRSGYAEDTGLPDRSVDWVCMASAFHWADAPEALVEFRRILRPGGFVTVMWNPRDLEKDPLQARIDQRIKETVPALSRRSSGNKAYTSDLEDTLRRGGLFGDVLFCEAPHSLTMSRDRYLGVWDSVNDVRAQAGEDRWMRIRDMIQDEIAGLEPIVVKYRTRAWTVRALET